MRLEFISALPEYLQYLGGFDIALDTFPFSGATTMCHTLWQGVPVVSRAGETGVSRMGKSILNAIGLPELCAESSDQFVEIASKLASDPDRLRELRATMRDRMKQSPLMDEAGYTRKVEAAYREMIAANLRVTPGQP